jgi:hypothetical protein
MSTAMPTLKKPAKGFFCWPKADAITPIRRRNGAKISAIQAYIIPIILATESTPTDLTMCIDGYSFYSAVPTDLLFIDLLLIDLLQ